MSAKILKGKPVADALMEKIVIIVIASVQQKLRSNLKNMEMKRQLCL